LALDLLFLRAMPKTALPLATLLFIFGSFSPTPADAGSVATRAQASLARTKWRQRQMRKNEALVRRFFQNYAHLGGRGFGQFRRAQSGVLARSSNTRVNNFGADQRYRGRAGYFRSIGDWSALFATGPDFRFELVGNRPDLVEVRLFGTLTLTRDGQPVTVPADRHGWTEIFRIRNGKIAHLRVNMNLDDQFL
jgi:hypothetical protein